MQHALHPILSDCKVVFARNLAGFYVSDGCVVFNAPRPLLGKDHGCKGWCHGRFFVEVDLSDSYAAAYIQKNNDLDARLVIPVTDAEVVEMLLMDNTRAEDYREYSFDDQLEMLLPQLSNIQSLPYGQAAGLIDAARAVLAADNVGS